MEIEPVKARIKDIIRECAQLPPGDIDEAANLHQELRIDSLTLLEIALMIDQEFKTDFSENELMTMASVQTAAAMVVNRLAAKSVSQPV